MSLRKCPLTTRDAQRALELMENAHGLIRNPQSLIDSFSGGMELLLDCLPRESISEAEKMKIQNFIRSHLTRLVKNLPELGKRTDQSGRGSLCGLLLMARPFVDELLEREASLERMLHEGLDQNWRQIKDERDFWMDLGFIFSPPHSVR